MLIVGYPSNTAIESRIVQIRVRNAWVLYTSDLKRPKAVQVTEKEQFNSREWNLNYILTRLLWTLKLIFFSVLLVHIKKNYKQL